MNKLREQLASFFKLPYTDYFTSIVSVVCFPIFIPYLFQDNYIKVLAPSPFVSISLYLLCVFFKVYEWASDEETLRPLNGAICFQKLLFLVFLWEIIFLIMVGHSFLASIPTQSILFVCQFVGFLVSVIGFYDMIPHHTDAQVMTCDGSLMSKFRLFFLGRHLVPLVGQMDLKFFWVGRVGMGLWFIVAFRWFMLMLCNYVSFSQLFASFVAMILTTAYIYDFYSNEHWYTQTIDMIHDRFGFMMAWGSVVWMPFVYSFVMYQISIQPPTSIAISLFCLISGGCSLIAFRLINNYRVKCRKSLETSNLPLDGYFRNCIPCGVQVQSAEGKKTYLITSGPYSFSRHPNYLADLCWCFSLCLVGQSLQSFLFFVFLLILLCNRCIRDEKRCILKYGQEKWNDYCNQIPYRIIRGVF
jgi:7-dehydrocholesterol reductase